MKSALEVTAGTTDPNHGISLTIINQARQDLKARQACLVKSLYTENEIAEVKAILKECLDTHSNTKRRSLDKHGLIVEIEHVSRRNKHLRDSMVYRRSLEFASAIYGQRCHYGFDHVIFKHPGGGSVRWHQDQFYSKGDLQKQCLSFWIPLQAVTTESGGMEYATSASRLYPHIPLYDGSHTHFVSGELIDHTDSIKPIMHLGDTCIHTPMSLHRSHPNTSQLSRGAWILQFNRYGPLRFLRWRNLKTHIKKIRSELNR